MKLKNIISILIVIVLLFWTGYLLGQRSIRDFPTDSRTVLGEISTSGNITIDEAIAIIGEARDSHIIFKAALEIGMAQATEWTGNIADQDRIIAQYNKVIVLLETLKMESLKTPIEKEVPTCCCQCSTK